MTLKVMVKMTMILWFHVKLEILKSLGDFMTDWPPRPPPAPTAVIRLHISFLTLPCRIAMQPSLYDANTLYNSVQKGQRYHLHKNVGVGCTKRGNIFHFFYTILITLVIGQTAQNFLDIRL